MDIRDVKSEKASDGSWLLTARVFYDGKFAGQFIAGGTTEVEAEKRLLEMVSELEKRIKAMSQAATAPTTTAPIVKTEKPWFVVVYNDNVHSFEQVIDWLQKSCGHCVQKAALLAKQIHETGCSRVFYGEKHKCNAVCKFLRHRGLQCEIDTVE